MDRGTPLVNLVAPADSAEGSQPLVLRGVLLSILFVATFAVVCGLLRMALPPLFGLTATHKLAYFADHRDEFDTVFVGPSTVYRQIDPVVFDDVLSRNGLESRSFNFGVNALTALETLHLVERILEIDAPRLRRVFIEIRGHPLDVRGRNDETLRFLSWHDFPTTWHAAALAIESEESLAWKWDYLRKTVRAFGFRFVSLGQLRRLVADHSRTSAPPTSRPGQPSFRLRSAARRGAFISAIG